MKNLVYLQKIVFQEISTTHGITRVFQIIENRSAAAMPLKSLQ